MFVFGRPWLNKNMIKKIVVFSQTMMVFKDCVK